MKLILFTGPQCSLCELAEDILDEYNSGASSLNAIEYEKVNIRLSSEHYHLYATRIPVVKRIDNENELGWPFTLAELKDFVQ